MAPRKKSGTAVAVRKEAEGVLATMADLANVSTGMEDLGADAYALPFLKLAQGLTPEVQDKDSGISVGDIFDSVSLASSENALIIPCAVRRSIIEWEPRSSGGGFVAEHGSWSAAKEFAESEDNDLIETYNYTVLYSMDGGETFYPARLSMKKTQVKIARRWNTNLQTLKVPHGNTRITPPIFGTVWNLGSVTQKNAKGTFANFDISYHGLVTTNEVFQQAQELNSISSEALDQPPTVEAEVVDEAGGDRPDF